MFGFFYVGGHFLICYSVPEAREVFKKLPEARGFAVLQYGPMASHGDFIHPQSYKLSMFLATQTHA